MSPYDGRYLAATLDIADADRSPPDIDWQEHFPGPYEHFTLTLNGRSALGSALAEIGPAAGDEIMIVTTSGSPYISSCVTKEIEKTCSWSRVLGPRTKAILVIHDFGFPATLPADIPAEIPIIEDCAWACVTPDADSRLGQAGDYVIYSFPKSWPMPFGGLLKTRSALQAKSAEKPLSNPAVTVLKRGLRQNFPRRQSIIEARIGNYRLYERLFAAAGFPPYFELKPGTVPHAFVFRLDDEVRAKRAKGFMIAAGVESSVFFGAGGYFLPNHQNLDATAVEYLHRRFLDSWARAA
jgi:hypothetical protein